MPGYQQRIRVSTGYLNETRQFLSFLKRICSSTTSKRKLKYRYQGKGYFKLSFEGTPGRLDAFFQELLLNKGLYYYSCTLSKRFEIARNVIIPIYSDLIEYRFQNPHSQFLMKHVQGKITESTFLPTDMENIYGYSIEIMYRKWDSGSLSNKDYVIDIDSSLTQFLLERTGHKEGKKSSKFGSLLKSIAEQNVMDREVRKTFERTHNMRGQALHRLSTPKSTDELYSLSVRLMQYFRYLAEFDDSQLIKTEMLNGKRYRRIRYGKEQYEGWRLMADEMPCGDCAVIKGQLHVEGCDIEECPCCRGQYLSCDCIREWQSDPKYASKDYEYPYKFKKWLEGPHLR